MAQMYPEDRSGTLASNKIADETQLITVNNSRNFHFFVPKLAPFYADGFKIFKNINDTLLPLVANVDYYFVYKFESASLSTTKDVFAGIAFTDLTVEGLYTLEYQTVGGNWTLDDQKILEIVANEIYNPRGRTWDEVVNYQYAFGPTQHIVDAADFMSQEQVGQKLGDIAEAVLESKNNPNPAPPITLDDLGIPKIGNWSMASVREAIDGISTDTIINPLTLRAVLDNLGLSEASRDFRLFREHIADTNNPHQDNKELIGLGNVVNIGTAPPEKILSNEDDTGLISLTDLKNYLRMHGCQTAEENVTTYAPAGSVMGYRCTSNYDRLVRKADGFGHTYEELAEANSVVCGYKPPKNSNYPPHGTNLQFYCLDFERWKIVADGYGGIYHVFVETNSGDCGFEGGTGATHPPAGSLLSAYCDGTVLVQTLANGKGSSYENRIPGHPQCANNVQNPPRGTLISTSCVNKNEIGKYTDGAGGYYEEVITQNAAKCGYTEVTTGSPITNAPYGTPMGSTCQGANFVNLFADGKGGTYSELVEANSSRCGITTTTTTTTTTAPLGPGVLEFAMTNTTVSGNVDGRNYPMTVRHKGFTDIPNHYTQIDWMVRRKDGEEIKSQAGRPAELHEGKIQYYLTNGMIGGTRNSIPQLSPTGEDFSSYATYAWSQTNVDQFGRNVWTFLADGVYEFYVRTTPRTRFTGGSTDPATAMPGTQVYYSNKVTVTISGQGNERPDPAAKYSASLSLVTPNTSEAILHTVNLVNMRRKGDVYSVEIIYRRPNKTEFIAAQTSIRVDGNGAGLASIPVPVWTRTNGETFIPDAIYDAFARVKNTNDGTHESTTTTITYSGFGTTIPSRPDMTLSASGLRSEYVSVPSGPFGIMQQVKRDIFVQSSVFNLNFTPGLAAGRRYELWIQPDAAGYQPIRIYQGTSNNTGDANRSWNVQVAGRDLTIDGTPVFSNSNTNKFMPSNVLFKHWIVVDGYRSNAILFYWTGPAGLTLNGSLFS